MDHFYENTDKTPEQILQTLKAREELPPLSVRLATGDENLVRLEITRRVLTEWSETERSNVLHVLNEGLNNSVKCVHLSGEGLGDFYAEAEWETFLSGLCSLPSLEELFIFHGSNPFLGQEYLAKHIVKAKKLRVLMMWGYSKYIPDYCAAVQKLPNLERNTLTLARTMKWSSMDMYCMAMAQLSSLKCLNLRCPHGCKDSIVSPEALAVLLQSKSIESLYMDNCGLIDDHTDVFAAELKENTVLKLLDIKNNLFSDDALFSMASCMPHNSTLTTLDLTGVTITEAGGRKLAKSMEKNSTMLFIELEGYAERYQDEFCIPEGSENEEWFKALDFRLRLNRAGFSSRKMARGKFVDGLNSVSDNVGCLYHILRHYPQYVGGENRKSVQQVSVS